MDANDFCTFEIKNISAEYAWLKGIPAVQRMLWSLTERALQDFAEKNSRPELVPNFHYAGSAPQPRVGETELQAAARSMEPSSNVPRPLPNESAEEFYKRLGGQ